MGGAVGDVVHPAVDGVERSSGRQNCHYNYDIMIWIFEDCSDVVGDVGRQWATKLSLQL